MKKRISVIMCLLITVILCSCGSQNNNKTEETSTEEISESHKENVSLEELESRCLEVEEKYDIEIIYGGKVVDFLKTFFGDDIQYSYDEEVNYKAVECIDEFFSTLPKGFLDELRNYDGKKKNIIITLLSGEKILTNVTKFGKSGELWMVYADKGFEMFLAAALYQSAERCMKYKSGNEEFFKDWNDYNPEGFEYKDNNEEYNKYVMFENKDESWFVDYPCLNKEIFDRCFTWACMFIPDEKIKEFYSLPHIRAKAEYICSEIDKAFDSVDETAYWNRFFVKE